MSAKNEIVIVVHRARYRIDVDRGGVLTIWRLGDSGETVVGCGRVERDRASVKVHDASPQLTRDLVRAIEEWLLTEREACGP
jgi:hypothetical protein